MGVILPSATFFVNTTQNTFKRSSSDMSLTRALSPSLEHSSIRTDNQDYCTNLYAITIMLHDNESI